MLSCTWQVTANVKHLPFDEHLCTKDASRTLSCKIVGGEPPWPNFLRIENRLVLLLNGFKEGFGVPLRS